MRRLLISQASQADELRAPLPKDVELVVEVLVVVGRGQDVPERGVVEEAVATVELELAVALSHLGVVERGTGK